MFIDKRRDSFFLALVAVLLAVFSTGPSLGARQKGPTKPPTYPTVAEFHDGGIMGDGMGPYYDGVDGVSSYRVSGSGTTNGWAWDLADRRSGTRRSLVYDLRNPIEGVSQGVIELSNTHGQIYDLSDMQVGEVRYVRAAFHLIINRVDYVLRYGQTAGDGSSLLEVTHIADGTFHVRTGGQGDLARYLRGNGPSAVLVGIYSVPLDLTLSNQ